MNTAVITVLMPVYNAERYLREAIDSILSQTYSNFEFMIINDGSTDSSENIILSYNDPRIRYIKNEQNIRLIATLNKGIELCRTKYIVRMDADDISVADRVQIQFDFMEANEDVAICGSWFRFVGSEQIIRYKRTHDEIMLKMLYQCHICHPAIIIRKKFIDELEIKFDSDMPHAEDYDLFTRVGERHKLANVQQVLLQYRVHESSVSFKNKQTQDDNSLRIKKRLFNKIGIDASENEIELFRKISQYEYAKTEDLIHETREILEKLLYANEKSAFFKKDFFRKALAQFWFNTCYNLAGIGFWVKREYRSSLLSKYYSLNTVQQLKFFLKPLLK
jgi:glycosyltransferase involved in cell wall biosynthesis